METLVDTAACAVVTLNDAVVDPSGTATNDGTEATTELEELSETMAPPTAAGAVRVTVPLADVPPWTLDGVRLTEARLLAGGTTAIVTDCVTTAVAEITALTVDEGVAV